MEESAGVQAHITKLCGCLLDAAFYSVSHRDALLSSLQPPSKTNAWCQPREQQIRALVHQAYDILLLRKWTWFSSWEVTPLSPLCWCVAYGYGYHMRGRGSEGQRLNSVLERFSSEGDILLPPFIMCGVLLPQAAVVWRRRRQSFSSWLCWLETLISALWRR